MKKDKLSATFNALHNYVFHIINQFLRRWRKGKMALIQIVLTFESDLYKGFISYISYTHGDRSLTIPTLDCYINAFVSKRCWGTGVWWHTCKLRKGFYKTKNYNWVNIQKNPIIKTKRFLAIFGKNSQTLNKCFMYCPYQIKIWLNFCPHV